MKKKIMLLGGNYYQMTATKTAKALGYHVISVDYLPDNPAHKYADEYYNISTLDKEAILELARRLQIDGIVSYASDISAPTAAYVSEQMGLPTNPYESVKKLTRKDLIRPFMEAHGFNTPKSGKFSTYEEALTFFKKYKKPLIVKPVDASGSKGVTKVYEEADFSKAYEEAMQYSHVKIIIIEEFLVRAGYQIAGDAFIWKGEIVFAAMMNEHFDKLCNPFVPIGESYPSILPSHLQQKARKEIERLMQLLDIKMGAINMDFMIDEEENIYILEIGPRNGGNLITDVIKEANGIDLAEYTLRAAVGEDCSFLKDKKPHTYVSSYVVHALKDGAFEKVHIEESIKKDILRWDMFVKEGEMIHRFNHGGYGIGAMLIKHQTVEEMLERMDHMEKYIRVGVK